MQYICLYKETALQSALRNNFALLSPTVFLNLRVNIPFMLMLFLRKSSDKMKIFRQAKF